MISWERGCTCSVCISLYPSQRGWHLRNCLVPIWSQHCGTLLLLNYQQNLATWLMGHCKKFSKFFQAKETVKIEKEEIAALLEEWLERSSCKNMWRSQFIECCCTKQLCRSADAEQLNKCWPAKWWVSWCWKAKGWVSWCWTARCQLHDVEKSYSQQWHDQLQLADTQPPTNHESTSF